MVLNQHPCAGVGQGTLLPLQSCCSHEPKQKMKDGWNIAGVKNSPSLKTSKCLILHFSVSAEKLQKRKELVGLTRPLALLVPNCTPASGSTGTGIFSRLWRRSKTESLKRENIQCMTMQVGSFKYTKRSKLTQ